MGKRFLNSRRALDNPRVQLVLADGCKFATVSLRRVARSTMLDLLLVYRALTISLYAFTTGTNETTLGDVAIFTTPLLVIITTQQPHVTSFVS